MAYKMLKYIQRTSGYFRKITSDGTSLTMYPDAAFAPSSSRSQTGWVIYYGGTPVLWRSSRQSTTALSTAEAESNAILEGSIAMLGIEAMLLDVSEEIHEQLIGSDSMSALSLTAGTGSWRTRHLRIKASWLRKLSRWAASRQSMFQGLFNQLIFSPRHYPVNAGVIY